VSHCLRFGNIIMSRIGKQIVNIPEKTEISLVDGVLTVKGPLGTLTRNFGKDNGANQVEIVVADKEVTVKPRFETPKARAMWGTYTSHIKNMVAGVNTAFEKKLILEGVGFKIEHSGNDLILALGFSHKITKTIPEGLTVVVEKNNMSITGSDKEKVGQFAAELRALKKPEPYKGKGMRYHDEVVRRKQGKKVA